jgi:hypothetical protein
MLCTEDRAACFGGVATYIPRLESRNAKARSEEDSLLETDMSTMIIIALMNSS